MQSREQATIHDGIEPSEVDIQRVRKFMEEGRFGELSEDLQNWVCGRLMPSLVRYVPIRLQASDSLRVGSSLSEAWVQAGNKPITHLDAAPTDCHFA